MAHHARSASTAPHPTSLPNCGYLIGEDQYNAVERAERAAALLSSICPDLAYQGAIEAPHMAAVADYIRGDLEVLLENAHYIPATPPPSGTPWDTPDA